MFGRSIPALITPFGNREFDEDTFRKFVNWQIEQGSSGVVPCGTTGESPTLNHEEHRCVTEACIDEVAGRVPVIAGCGSNSTREAIGLTKHAEEAGADGALIVTPYYNKPSQEGMFQHFKAINDTTNIPIIIYNIPGRSVVDMSVETMARCYQELENVVGVKDATADLARPLALRNLIGDNFCQLSGEDATATGYLAQGGHGCISVSSNVAPALCSQQHEAWQNGDLDTMVTCRDALAPLHDALFVESSPAPVKYAASELDLCSDAVRLPLVKASNNARSIVDHAIEFAGLKGNTAKAVNG